MPENHSVPVMHVAFAGLLRKLDAHGKIVVLVTHNMEIAQQAGRMIEVSDGHIQ